MIKKIFSLFFVSLCTGLVVAPVALAASEEAAGKGNPYVLISIMLAAGFGMCFAAIGVGKSQGQALKTGLEGIARNPAAGGKILTTMLVGLAMLESLAIYALLVALILLFANPFKAMI